MTPAASAIRSTVLSSLACADPRLAEVFARLPESVYKVEADTRMIALYWSERGETAVLHDIAYALDTLA